MKAYYLSKHVFACVEGGYLVFLDLANDEYFCVAQDDLNSLYDSCADENCCPAARR